MQINQLPDKATFCELAKKFNVIPVSVEILADTETPVSTLQKFYDSSKPVFLLESAAGGERWGRFSFLGISARCHIRVYADIVEIQGADELERIPHQGDPLKILKAFMDRYLPAQLSELPRFWGGVVGYLTYEMVSFFESIPHHYDAAKPLAHFVLPDELIIFDNIRHTLYCVVTGFISNGRAPGDIYDAARGRIREILDIIETPVHATDKKTFTQKPVLQVSSRALPYQEIVRRTKRHIYQGDIIQAVISQPFVYESAPDPWLLYRAQRYINPSPYLYFMRLDDITLVDKVPQMHLRLL